MGADFKEKAKQTFEKCWDSAAVNANTPDLFRKSAEHSANRFEAEPVDGKTVIVGESLCVRVEDGRVIGRRGNTPVLTIAAPTPALIKSLLEGCNIGRADVMATDGISGVLEVTIH